MSEVARVVDLVSGEVAEALDAAAARDLTERIRRTAERLWELLLEAHERHAWVALGYRTWADYVRAEFDMGRSHSYRLLDQGRVIRALEEAAGVPHGGHPIEIGERAAREIKPRLVEVTERVRERVAEEPEPAAPAVPGPAEAPEVDHPSPAPVAPERVREIVDEVVGEELQRRRKRREDREATEAFIEEFELDKVDDKAEAARVALTFRLFDAMDHLAHMPPVAEVLAAIPDYQRYRFADLDAAVEWLDEFAAAWGERA